MTKMSKTLHLSDYNLLADIAEVERLIRARVASACTGPTTPALSPLSMKPFDLEPFEGGQISLRFHTGHGLEHNIVFTVTAPKLGLPINTPKRREALANEVSRRVVAAFENAAAIETLRADILRVAEDLRQSASRDGAISHVVGIAPQTMIVGDPDAGAITAFHVEIVGSFRHASGTTVRGHTTIVASDQDTFAAGFRKWVAFETQRALEPRFRSVA